MRASGGARRKRAATFIGVAASDAPSGDGVVVWPIRSVVHELSAETTKPLTAFTQVRGLIGVAPAPGLEPGTL